MKISQETVNGTTPQASNYTSQFLSEDNKNTNLKRYTPPMFIVALLTIVKIWQQPRYELTEELI